MKNARERALLIALTALFGGRGKGTTPDTSRQPRPPRDEFQVQAKRLKRLERGRRQYEKWVQSGGRP